MKPFKASETNLCRETGNENAAKLGVKVPRNRE